LIGGGILSNWRTALVVIVTVSPIPIGLLVGIAALVEILVVPMVIAFPLPVIPVLGGPLMVVVVIRIVNARLRSVARRGH
jgi:hypothetical protein